VKALVGHGRSLSYGEIAEVHAVIKPLTGGDACAYPSLFYLSFIGKRKKRQGYY
jgi:hypothetical protein